MLPNSGQKSFADFQETKTRPTLALVMYRGVIPARVPVAESNTYRDYTLKTSTHLSAGRARRRWISDLIEN